MDKGPNVDAEGWAYAPDFGSMAWPPPPGSDRKGVVDFVRRRRLVRCRRHSLAPAPPQPGGSRRASLAGSDGSEERDLPAASASGAGVRSLGVLASGGLLPLPYDWQTCGTPRLPSHVRCSCVLHVLELGIVLRLLLLLVPGRCFGCFFGNKLLFLFRSVGGGGAVNMGGRSKVGGLW